MTDRTNNNLRSTLTADLCVDATGRASKFPLWLQSHGIDVPEQRDDAEIVYYTRHYQLKEGVEEPDRHKNPPCRRSGLYEIRRFSRRWQSKNARSTASQRGPRSRVFRLAAPWCSSVSPPPCLLRSHVLSAGRTLTRSLGRFFCPRGQESGLRGYGASALTSTI